MVVLPYEGIRIEEDTSIQVINGIDVVLDNIRSALNVGSIFRTADGCAINHIHLCGITPTPDHPKVAKTALGAECIVNWTQHWNTLEAVKELQSAGFYLIAIESSNDSESLYDFTPTPINQPLALILGNEITGVDPDVLGLCQRRIHLPMFGAKRSLNVSIAFGITAYFLRYKYYQKN